MNLSTLAHTPADGQPDLLFIAFHGVGGSARDMMPMVQRLAAEYPQAAVVSVNAPDAFDALPGGGSGLQWFSIGGVTEVNRPARVAKALPAFVAAVRQLQRHFQISWDRTALVGFSQGGTMVLEAVQAEPDLAGRVLAFGGRHATPPTHAPVDTCVHLFHGLDDEVTAPGPVVDAAQRLVALGADVTADLLPGVGHELHPELLSKAVEQLRTFLPKKVWRQAMSEAPVIPRTASSEELGPSKR